MANIITNQSQLDLLVMSMGDNIVNYITQKFVDTIQDCMDRYDIPQQGQMNGKVYVPTGQFYNAWRQEASKSIGNYFEGAMLYDYDMVQSNPSNFEHGSYYSEKGYDVSEFMPDIIFNGLSGDLFGDGFWRDPRNAWDDFVNEVNQNFDVWMQEAFDKYSNGLKVTKGASVTISSGI